MGRFGVLLQSAGISLPMSSEPVDRAAGPESGSNFIQTDNSDYSHGLHGPAGCGSFVSTDVTLSNAMPATPCNTMAGAISFNVIHSQQQQQQQFYKDCDDHLVRPDGLEPSGYHGGPTAIRFERDSICRATGLHPGRIVVVAEDRIRLQDRTGA